ncbi:MAG: methyltransferase domain-containing protein [Candidatus Muirbacterium halophilum]|nr:methyltransferase domain-containing protein [Candidatus Muirbacterium halophilum]
MGQILNDAEFQMFKDFVYRSSGMDFNQKNKLRMEFKLKDRLAELGYKDFNSYYAFLNKRSVSADIEVKVLLDLLTVNETSFFRNSGHFKAYTDTVLPELFEKKPSIFTKKVAINIWSAGCSTGQEPYSLAVAYLEKAGLKASNMQMQIYATDISETALSIAKEGNYAKKRLQNMPPNVLKKYFIEHEDRIEVKPEVKKMITFMYANMKTSTYLRGLDVIFCRNVMIYFDDAMREHAIKEFHKALNPGGYFFIGHSESLSKYKDLFDFKVINGGIVYKKIGD